MAQVKISELTAKGSALQGTDLLEISQLVGSTYVSKSVNGGDIIDAAQSGMQSELISGTNIKTINASGNWAIENGTGTSDIATAILQVNSTTKGFLPPRMTTAQKNAIASPAAGLVVYDTTLNKLCVYTTAWETITSI